MSIAFLLTSPRKSTLFYSTSLPLSLLDRLTSVTDTNSIHRALASIFANRIRRTHWTMVLTLLKPAFDSALTYPTASALPGQPRHSTLMEYCLETVTTPSKSKHKSMSAVMPRCEQTYSNW